MAVNFWSRTRYGSNNNKQSTLVRSLHPKNPSPHTPHVLRRKSMRLCPAKKLMEPGPFLNALQDPIPSGDSIDELVNDWQLRLTSAIDTIAPLRLFHPRPKWAPWYTEELRGKKKRELRHLERTWRKTRKEATRTSYRTLMRSYETAIKTAKRE